MAVLNTITLDLRQSPRNIIVAEATTELVVQDLHDTVQDAMEEPANGTHPILIKTTGKQELLGGDKVGLTGSIQNGQVVFFADRTTVQAGTVTTADVSGVTLTDTAATFITNSVAAGSWVVNRSDGSCGTVKRVVSETQLLLFRQLGSSGTNNQWNLGDVFSIWGVSAKTLGGGNPVAVDSNGDSINPLLPSCLVLAQLTAASNATQQELLDIQFSSFRGAVSVDTANTTGRAGSGVDFPAGTERQPCLLLSDAALIEAARGLFAIRVFGDLDIDSGSHVNIVFEGDSPTKTTITIRPLANTLNCEFLNATVTGTLDGGSTITACHITTLSVVEGNVIDCSLESGLITLSGVGQANFINCQSGLAGSVTPVLDLGGSGSALTFRNYSGGIELRNKTGADALSMDMSSGKIVLHSTISNGTLKLRGQAELVDNSTGTAIVLSEHLLDVTEISLIRKMHTNRLEAIPGNPGSLVLYDDDGTAVLKTWLLRDHESAAVVGVAGSPALRAAAT